MINTRKGIVRASMIPRMLAMVYDLSLTGSLPDGFGIGFRMRGEEWWRTCARLGGSKRAARASISESDRSRDFPDACL